MSLQHIFPQSVTMGQRTAGADGDVTKVNLPGDYVLEFTGNGIFILIILKPNRPESELMKSYRIKTKTFLKIENSNLKES